MEVSDGVPMCGARPEMAYMLLILSGVDTGMCNHSVLY